jgi:hypothetical protein
MARKMGRIQAYEYWSEQYHSARLLVKMLVQIQHGMSVWVRDPKTGQGTSNREVARAKVARVLPLARRREARMLAIAESLEKPVPRKAKP